MTRWLVVMAIAGAPRYTFEPCSVLGRFPDGGGGGTVCEEALRDGGVVRRTEFSDGSRLLELGRRVDGGLTFSAELRAADAGLPRGW